MNNKNYNQTLECCRRPPNAPDEERVPPVPFDIGLTTVQDSQIVTVLNPNQRVQIRQIVLRKQILKEVPNMDCYATYRVAHQNVFIGKIRKS